MQTEIVYGLHFISPLNPTRPAQHYIGSCKKLNLYKRLQLHATGKSGVKYIEAYYKKRIPFVVFGLWKGSKQYERLIKNKKNARKYCPICKRREQDGTNKTIKTKLV